MEMDDNDNFVDVSVIVGFNFIERDCGVMASTEDREIHIS